jgi:hypothetical protein
MRTIACLTVLALVLISAAKPTLTSASGGPSASGTYRFVSEDDLSKSVTFNASSNERSEATGQMTFSDEALISDADPESEERDEPRPLSFTAALDGLTIDGTRAVMSGVITGSSHRSYIGRWVQLVVEDNREGADQLNWRVCQVEPGGWVPVDSEDPRDEGAYWHWWATDAEIRDDVGIASRNIIPGQTRGCEAISLSAYSFAELRGEGEVTVQP